MPKRIVITGGSSGIGEALVRQFAKDGWIVAFTYLTHEKEARALAGETGALCYCCDVRDEASVKNTAKEILKLLHHPDGLINNAGIAQKALLEDMQAAEWDNIMGVHLRGAFLWSRALLPSLRESRGAILNISSIWGQTGASCEAAYSAAKAGLIGLTKALAREAAPDVRVNAIAPGVIETPMLKEYNEEDLEALRAEIPLGRLGKPEDVARSAAFMMSDAASYITGQVLAVNGGMYC